VPTVRVILEPPALPAKGAESVCGHQDEAGVGAGDVDGADDDGEGAVAFEAADRSR
jgi:hypothetical protein